MASKFTLLSTFLLLSSSLAHVLPRADEALEKRGTVDDCKAVLIALKASSFCSSFVPITDSTKWVTSTKPVVTNTEAVTAPPCTVTGSPAAAVTVTAFATATTQTTTTATVTVTVNPNVKRAAAPMPAAPAAAKATCSIKGLPVKISSFTCDVIKQACNAYVKPKTVTSTTTVPGATVKVTNTVTKPCQTITPTPTSTATSTVTVTNTATETATTTASVCTFTGTRTVTASNGQQFSARDDRFWVGGKGVGSTSYGIDSEVACADLCTNTGGCNFYTWSNSYSYCELFSEASCTGLSSDFKCGKKI